MADRVWRTAAVAALACLAAAPAAAERTHTVVKGDHLWGLAGFYYKNNFRWRAIYAANTEKIKDPHWIYPGQIFVIPDLPGPEVGELAARPVETEEAFLPVGEPPPAPPPPPDKPALKEVPTRDDLSVKIPPGLSGQYPSLQRYEFPKGWKEDGRVTEFEGRESMAAQGDRIDGRVKRGAAKGDKFVVYRQDSAEELDTNMKSRFLQRVGLVQVQEELGRSRYRFLILQSSDAVQVGDLLKREGT